MTDFFAILRAILHTELFKIANTSITPFTLASVTAVIIATFWVSRALRNAVERVLTWKGERPAFIGTVKGLIHYTVLLTGFGIALSTAGIDLTALFAAGAIISVGFGFAMQSIAQNFVAGVILLTERTIKPGDVLEVEGTVVKVLEIGIRSSVARTRDGEDLILPNATLIQTTVKNFTFGDSSYRIRAIVGVTYDSDMAAVKKALNEVGHEISERWAVHGHFTQVILTGFGDNSVNWEVSIWMSDPWGARPALSDLHEAIWWKLKAEGIVIAFPQLDVHLDHAALEALGAHRVRTSASAT
ncbi:MAG: mechanosensitive ion channel [Deltaproteobacteria bacterium]|nr:mechanosensitive ion channel [Deltaproteobacteria bacterium]